MRGRCAACLLPHSIPTQESVFKSKRSVSQLLFTPGLVLGLGLAARKFLWGEETGMCTCICMNKHQEDTQKPV